MSGETAKAGDELGLSLGAVGESRADLPEGDQGTCGFCGEGGGYLLEQGDETSQVLHAAVRSGEPPNATYAPHPNAYGTYRQTVTWCGRCIGGLKHKYQRYDDTNLHAAHVAAQVRLELDGLRWSHWSDKSLKEGAHKPDDPAIHLEKLAIQRDIEDMQNEKFRRAGFDLTSRGWRP